MLERAARVSTATAILETHYGRVECAMQSFTCVVLMEADECEVKVQQRNRFNDFWSLRYTLVSVPSYYQFCATMDSLQRYFRRTPQRTAPRPLPFTTYRRVHGTEMYCHWTATTSDNNHDGNLPPVTGKYCGQTRMRVENCTLSTESHTCFRWVSGETLEATFQISRQYNGALTDRSHNNPSQPNGQC